MFLEMPIKRAFELVEKQGFAAVDLCDHPILTHSLEIYSKMDSNYSSGKRGKYYNEISFHWPEEWADLGGIICFHEAITVESIFDFNKAESLIESILGKELANELLTFVLKVKALCIKHHPDYKGRTLRVGRVMLRQMGENESTNHRAYEWHEDIGYPDRPVKQYLTAAITLHGKPTEAERYSPKVGELLIFNNYHRRLDKGMPEELAFKHRGPKSGPKLFLFFEFLIPN